MNKEALIAFMENANIIKAYVGKQGCACGCGGDYHEQGKGSKQIKMALKRVIKALDDYENKTHTIELIKGLGTEWILSLEKERVATRLYFELNRGAEQ